MNVRSVSLVLAIALACGVPCFAADTLIFNNSTYAGYVYPSSPASYAEMLDYATSGGGYISKFAFRYSATSAGTVWVRFYQSTNSYYPGVLLKQLAVSFSSTGGALTTREYVIPEQDRFQLPAGNFGYSFEFSNATYRLALATGGTGIDQYFWQYDSFYGDLVPYYFSSSYNFYFQLYKGPSIEEVTCDITGYKFNDLNGNAVWDAGEPAIAGWEIYLDTNGDGIYQAAEPNEVTDPNGYYRFENMPAPGSYPVREILTDGWRQTLPGVISGYQYLLWTEPNHVYGPYNFGNLFSTDPYEGGSGTAEDPYLIATAAQMNNIGARLQDWDKHFRLIADINLGGYGGTSFNLIGNEYTQNSGGYYSGSGFTGVFDGQGHTISNFTYNAATTNNIALFRGVTGGCVTGVRMVNVNVRGRILTGGLVGALTDGSELSDCHVESGLVSGYDMTGGLAGYTGYDAVIVDSSAGAAVSGNENVGGITGFATTDSYLARCFVTGNVSAYRYVGGFVGLARENIIEQCYATGNVTGSYPGRADVGGFAGSIYDYTDVIDCYARGSATGYDYVGNFVGTQGETGATIRCYATGLVSGTGINVHGFAGRRMMTCTEMGANYFDSTITTKTGCIGIGKTTTQMRQKNTYQGDYFTDPWDFDTPMWTIEEGVSYPKLWWETYYYSDQYGGGTGRPGDPFLISTAEHLHAIGANPADWDKHFRLENDIDLAAYDGLEGRPAFNCIGTVTPTTNTPFTGVFDGNNKTIHNFTYVTGRANGIGLFVLIDTPAEIKNLTLSNPVIQDQWQHVNYGALAGKASGGTVRYCHVIGGSIHGDDYTGGLIGDNTADIYYCSSTAEVTGTTHTGGLTGRNQGRIYQSYAAGDVTGTSLVGGLIGRNSNSFSPYGYVYDSYATGRATGSSSVGGLIGQIWGGDVRRCYAAGLVSGTSSVGGLIGGTSGTAYTCTASFWDTQTTGRTTSVAGTSKTTEQMQSESTYTSAGWDFNDESANGTEDIWFIQPQNYPKLCRVEGLRYGGGSGSAADPYLIYTASQMNAIGLNTDDFYKHFKLMADISMAAYTGTLYNQIGKWSTTASERVAFRGVFDGNGHTISGFQSKALFDYVANGAIRNLGLLAPVVSDNGAIVDRMEWGSIADCWVDGGSVTGSSSVGGLAGLLNLSSAAGCWSSAWVSGTNDVGGLIGYLSAMVDVQDCYAAGNVSGQSRVGGFVGHSYNSAMKNCYARGLVSGTTSAGGFCGYSEQFFPLEAAYNCFWDSQTSGQATSAAGTAKTTAELKTLSTFIDAGWDLAGETANGRNDDWSQMAGSYPVLTYQLDIPLPPPTFASGSGTEADPYLVATVQQLNSIGHKRHLMDKHFRLSSDLDLAQQPFAMIADSAYAFSGSFDGNSKTIRNLTIARSSYCTNLGFIGAGFGGQVRNLTLQNVTIDAPFARNTGAVIGFNRSGTVQDCHIQGGRVDGLWSVGGLAGVNYWYASISRCSFVGSISENTEYGILGSPIGGAAGENSYWSAIELTGVQAHITGDDFIGGLAGNNILYAQITDCYALGSIDASAGYSGGLCGRTLGGNTFTRCYAACTITAPAGTQRLGTLAGSESSGTYTDCFWDSQINAALPTFGSSAASTVLVDTAGQTTQAMKAAGTYQAQEWDFANVWRICEGMNYPRLQCQPLLPGDLACPEGVEFTDILLMADQWLATGASSADIAPSAPDGNVNLQDFAALAANWLLGLD